MKCPNCRDVALAIRERLDLAIRHCPRCGGVWLSQHDLLQLSDRTGLFLKARGRSGLCARALPGLKQPLWKELFEVEPQP